VLTCDLDLGAILAASRGRAPSVIQLRDERLAAELIGNAVVSAIRKLHRELAAGVIVSIDASRARLRVLPLGD
jgi:predicted nuclease of predicted toxin-antitoxin system